MTLVELIIQPSITGHIWWIKHEKRRNTNQHIVSKNTEQKSKILGENGYVCITTEKTKSWLGLQMENKGLHLKNWGRKSLIYRYSNKNLW